jgi:hypothetical protein
MGNQEDNYENDPYIQQSQHNNAIKNLYSNQGLSSVSHGDSIVDMKQLSEQQEKRQTVAYQNPIKVDRNSIKLEQDAYDKNIFYITFEYTCDRTIYANFYFNAEFTPSNPNNMFTPSPAFRNNIIRIWFPAGQKIKFRDPNLKINVDYFLKNKVFGRNFIDLIMELYVKDNSGQNIECILASFCSIIFKPGTNDFKIKYLYQKCKVMGSQWYDIEDIYGLTSEDNLCEICCTNPRNTFFLPCKHSYTCQDCAILIRAKDEKCPICRQKINDSVVLTNVSPNAAPLPQ